MYIESNHLSFPQAYVLEQIKYQKKRIQLQMS